MIENCTLGKGVRILFPELVNLYRCTIGAESFIGPFVEIQQDVEIGDACKIESHTFICSGVVIGNRVFVGHGATFTNDLFPAIDAEFTHLYRTFVDDWAIIGSGATILPTEIGYGAIVGAGAVVVQPVPRLAVVAGNPAKIIRQFSNMIERDLYFADRKRNHLHAL